MEGRTVGWFSELFSLSLYKRNQGQIARRATFGALATIIALGCWRLMQYYADQEPLLHYYVPAIFLAVGLWASFRIIQMPAFADFLISVEGEMNKVSWPARGELFRASLVVILVIFFLAALLFAYDAILTAIVGPNGLLDRIVGWLFG
jgi:preprotein translocase subunit SecE